METQVAFSAEIKDYPLELCDCLDGRITIQLKKKTAGKISDVGEPILIEGLDFLKGYKASDLTMIYSGEGVHYQIPDSREDPGCDEVEVDEDRITFYAGDLGLGTMNTDDWDGGWEDWVDDVTRGKI